MDTNLVKEITSSISKISSWVNTVKVDENFNVKERLKLLSTWENEYRERDRILQARQHILKPNIIDRQIGVAIAQQRRRLRIILAQAPLELDMTGINAFRLKSLKEKLFSQFVGLTKDEKRLWLNNFEFILTPDLKSLYKKIEQICEYRSVGQQRCLLVSGPAGMGKTTCLNALVMRYEPEIANEVTIVSFVKIDAPANNRSSRSFYRRIINALGLSYTKSDTEEDLLETAIAFLDACQTEILIIDEIEQMTKPELKRQVLDLSNQTRGIPIICASCTPAQWTDGDKEIMGRWNDEFPLSPFNENTISGLLAHLEILLPFSKPSHLDEWIIRTHNGEELSGPASFIYKTSKGILRDIMILVRDACKYAIDHDLPCLDMTTLQRTWKKIQENPNPLGTGDENEWTG